MKIFVYSDEWYPCYSIVDGYGEEIEVTEAEYKMIEESMVLFSKAQKIMSEKCEAKYKK